MAEISTEIFEPGKEEIIGDYEIIHDYYSDNLKNERDIIVWLPPGYKYSHKNYPVLFMNDGQNLFSPKISYTGYDWRVDEIVSDLIASNKIEEIVIVGIYNLKDRIDEYNYFTEKGKSYAKFLTVELLNYIEENFRVIQDRSGRAIMGSSMGGLNAFQMAWYFPHIFGKAGCMSNSFWAGNKLMLKEVRKSSVNPMNQKIYLDCGTEEKEMIKDNKSMCRLLQKSGFTRDENLLCYFPEGAKHKEEYWSKRFHIPLQFLFGKNK